MEYVRADNGKDRIVVEIPKKRIVSVNGVYVNKVVGASSGNPLIDLLNQSGVSV